MSTGRQRATNRVFLVITFLLCGCATENNPGHTNPPIYMTRQEFASDVVLPAFQLIIATGAYYVETGNIPGRHALEAYTKKLSGPINWQRFRNLEISETAEDVVIRVDIDSTNRKEPVSTSWKFFVKKSPRSAQSLDFSVSPQSYLCVRGQRTTIGTMVELFLDVAAGYLTKTNVPLANSELCFHPGPEKLDVKNEKTQRTLKKLKDRMRDKLQHQKNASSP